MKLKNNAEKLKNIAEKLRNIAEKLRNIAEKLFSTNSICRWLHSTEFMESKFPMDFSIFLLVNEFTLKLSNCYSSKKTSKSKKRQEILTINLSWQMQLFSLFLPISHGLEKSQLFIFYDQSLRPKSFTSCNEGYNQNGCWQWHNNEIWGEKKIQFSWCNCLLGT